MASYVLGSALLSLPLLLAQGLGVVVGIVLVARRGDTVAWLALIGFGLLGLANLLSLMTMYMPFLASQIGMMAVETTLGCFTLLLNLIAAAGVLCLTGALWRGVGGANPS